MSGTAIVTGAVSLSLQDWPQSILRRVKRIAKHALEAFEMIINITKMLPNQKNGWRKRRAAIDTIILHCTAGSEQSPFEITRRVLDRHKTWRGMPYHYLVQTRGNKSIYKCLDSDRHSYHARAANRRSIGVSLAYRARPDQTPDADVMSRTYRLLARLCFEHRVTPARTGDIGLLGHRELSWMYRYVGRGEIRYVKECPGMAINLDVVRFCVVKLMQQEMARQNHYHGRTDGIWGPKSRAAFEAATFCSTSPFLQV